MNFRLTAKSKSGSAPISPCPGIREAKAAMSKKGKVF